MFNPHLHHRRSIRLKGYDYSGPGFYFITTLTEGGLPIFGKIINDQMQLKEVGRIVERRWQRIPEFFQNVILHEYLTMPEHTHGIIEIAGEDYNSRNTEIKDLFQLRCWTDNFLESGKIEFRSPSKTIGSFVRGFKFGVVKDCKELKGKSVNIFQRDYYEEIIKDYQSFRNITEYIKNNPANYKKDKKRDWW